MTAHEMLLAPIAHMPPSRIVDGLSPGQAATRPAGLPHSVVDLVAHLVFWQAWLLGRARGSTAPMAASAAAGWPQAGADDWEGLRARFLADLEQAVQLGDGQDAATRPVLPPLEFPPLAHYTVRDVVTHVALHNAHHLGQVVTVRQALGAWPPPEGSWTW